MDFSNLIIAAYVRVSREQQDETRQIRRIEEWAAKHNASVTYWFIDSEGKNPRDRAKDRKEFQRLYSLIETVPIDVVVVSEQDRFGVADWAEHGHYVHLLHEKDIMLWSAKDGFLSDMDNDASAITSTLNVQKSRGEQKGIADRMLLKKVMLAEDGVFSGGYPPYGCDVVCFSKSGKVLWRVHYDGGHHRRVKIIGDKRERYDGKENFPARDIEHVLRLQPTIALDRIQTLRNIFAWYVEEKISPTQIATRLRELGVSACFGDWNKQKIKSILRNPAAIGYPTFNKQAQGRFTEWVDGDVKQVKKTGAGRRRSEDDWVRSKVRQYDPIVEEAMFEAAQTRLKEQSEKYSKKRKNSPRKAPFWLRNLAVCWKCGREMRIRSQNGGAYYCATYGTYGKSNRTGCRCHAISKRVLEQIVDDYLEQAHHKIAELIKVCETGDSSLFAGLECELLEKYSSLAECWKRLEQTVENNPDIRLERRQVTVEFLESDRSDVDLKKYFRAKLNLYHEAQLTIEDRINAEIVDLEAERERLSNLLSRLPESATRTIQQTSDELAEIEGLLVKAEHRRKDMASEMWDRFAELKKRRDALDRVRAGVSDDAGFRRKAELVSQVIEMIVVEFDERNEKAANRPKSVPVKIEIIPKLGDSYVFRFPDGHMPEKD